MDEEKHAQEGPSARQDGQKEPGKKHEAMASGKIGKAHGEGSGEKAQAEKCGCAMLEDKCLRMAAEFDNYKKRTVKEKEALCAQSEARLMLRLLPIYEEIGLAEREVAKIDDKPVREGALLVLAKLQKGFEKEGLLPMKLLGEKLDPFRHETAMREDSDAPEGTIVRVIKQGYLYKGEVLQHAIVSVSSGKAPDADGSADEKGTGKGEGKEA
jgi:molecular chaperone GrpE